MNTGTSPRRACSKTGSMRRNAGCGSCMRRPERTELLSPEEPANAMSNPDADSRAPGIPYAGEACIGSLAEPGAVAERLLLREVSHRINNELASAISLISVAAHRCTSDEAKTALTTVLDRLES